MSFWKELQETTDELVDIYFGEPVEFHPYKQNSEYEEVAVPDTSRSMISTIGVYVTPGAAITGEGGTMGSGLASRTVVNQAWVSITDDQFDADTMGRKSDRVYFPERDLWYEVAYDPPPSATHRPNIPLIALDATDIPDNP